MARTCTFSPFSTQSSPSRTAVVRMPVASESAARSVIEKQILFSALTSGTRNLPDLLGPAPANLSTILTK